MNLSNLLYINGRDAWTSFGVFLAEEKTGGNRNYSALLAPSGVKDTKAVSFREDDGERLPEVLIPRLAPRDITLTFALYGSNASEFNARYAAFFEYLRSGDKGWLTLRLPELSRTFKVVYQSTADYRQFGNFVGNKDAMCARFSVKFREPKPAY